MYVRALDTESKETLWLQRFVTVAATDPGQPSLLYVVQMIVASNYLCETRGFELLSLLALTS